jgi:hypothetical protein
MRSVCVPVMAASCSARRCCAQAVEVGLPLVAHAPHEAPLFGRQAVAKRRGHARHGVEVVADGAAGAVV